ncbi:hypothetical protein N7456_002614 [Penicillium angulare]|uniref:Uncharacterized protein n=1 Tax=Penicillium angulare TaxID=116970 RepID=A0A9W9G9J4_9EURO|nr:hypothetical protein N7456_002614 [Penicillium angulare]
MDLSSTSDYLPRTMTPDPHEPDDGPIFSLATFNLWALEIGALRGQTNVLSLDHRLKNAPSLEIELRKSISALIDFAKNVALMLSNDVSHGSYEIIVPEDSDPNEEWEAFKREEENQEYSELDENLLDIQHTLDSLNKLSKALKNPTLRDEREQAALTPQRGCCVRRNSWTEE